MNNLKGFLVRDKNDKIFPIGETGIYVSSDEFSQFVLDWIYKTSDSKKKEQLENLGKTLVVGGIFALFLSALFKD